MCPLAFPLSFVSFSICVPEEVILHLSAAFFPLPPRQKYLDNANFLEGEDGAKPNYIVIIMITGTRGADPSFIAVAEAM